MPPREHECIQKDKIEQFSKDFESVDKNFKGLYKFKETVLTFMGAKEVVNGNLKEVDKTLKEQMESGFENLNTKFNWIIGLFCMLLFTVIGSLIAYIRL